MSKMRLKIASLVLLAGSYLLDLGLNCIPNLNVATPV